LANKVQSFHICHNNFRILACICWYSYCIYRNNAWFVHHIKLRPRNLRSSGILRSLQSVPTFRDKLSVPFWMIKSYSWISWNLKMGPISCLETSIGNYHSTLRDVPQERILHLRRVGSLKSRFGHETCDMPQHIHHLHWQFSELRRCLFQWCGWGFVRQLNVANSVPLETRSFQPSSMLMTGMH